jgi:hypothetical protein
MLKAGADVLLYLSSDAGGIKLHREDGAARPLVLRSGCLSLRPK